MKVKYFIIGGAGLIVFVLLFLLILNLHNATAFSNSVQINVLTNNIKENEVKDRYEDDEYQEAVLSMRNWEYVVTPSTLKKGVPVRMTVDLNTVVGCARDVTIKDFGVRKYVKPGDNIIKFTPTKTGNIDISCSMNMFFGKFEVVNDDKELQQHLRSKIKSQSEITNINSIDNKLFGKGSLKCGCGMRN